jgi:hypothetical protein
MPELKHVTVIDVRVDHEWGTFFVRESDVVPREGGKGFNASAEWTANTSFGVFGHYWSSMGQPFGEFIKGVDDYYLLGKIGNQVTDDKLIVAGVKRLVREHRKAKSINAETAREAFDTIVSLASEYGGEILCHELYQASELSFIDDWDVESRSYDGQSMGFVKKLWPEFVKKYNQQKVAVSP